MKRGRKKQRQGNSDDPWAKWGGYMNCKLHKLSHLEYGSLQSNIFKGVSIYVNGYTEPNAIELHRLIKTNGGLFFPYYSKKLVTHIIASNLAVSKILKLTDYERVVKASWITESLKIGKLLPIDEFRLYKKIDKKQPLLTKLLYKSELQDIGESCNEVYNLNMSKRQQLTDDKKELNLIDSDEDLFLNDNLEFNYNIDGKNKYDYGNEELNNNIILSPKNELNNYELKTHIKNNFNSNSKEDKLKYLTFKDNENIVLSSNRSLSDEDMFLDQNINNDNNNVINELEVKLNIGNVFIPSQIDQEVLNELPFELQNEIRQQITRNKLNEFQNKNLFTFTGLPINNALIENSKKLPNKTLEKKRKKVILNKSPIKTKNKLSRKNKNNFYNKRYINSNYNGDSLSQIDENVFNNLPEEIKAEIKQQLDHKQLSNQNKFANIKSTNQNKCKKDLNYEDVEQYLKACNTYNVDLNGRLDLDEVKEYIRLWIESTDEPLEEDLQVLNEYFVKLLENAQLDFIYCIAKYMLRLSGKEIAWTKIIHKFIENVQNNIIIVYGKPLKL